MLQRRRVTLLLKFFRQRARPCLSLMMLSMMISSNNGMMRSKEGRFWGFGSQQAAISFRSFSLGQSWGISGLLFSWTTFSNMTEKLSMSGNGFWPVKSSHLINVRDTTSVSKPAHTKRFQSYTRPHFRRSLCSSRPLEPSRVVYQLLHSFLGYPFRRVASHERAQNHKLSP